MLGKILKIFAALIIVVAGYLLFWPVMVEPVAWKSPVNLGYVGDFAPNTKLGKAELLELGGGNGPEDGVVDKQGFIYAALNEGRIVKIDPKSKVVTTFAETGGRPLGMEFDAEGNLIVADSHKGLLSISTDGKITLLAEKYADGKLFGLADDLDIAPDGKIYFSDATTKFSARAAKGTYNSSLLDLMEHGPYGNLLRYDPVTKKIEILIKGMSFANGVVVDPQGSFVLVVSTGSYNVVKYWLKGEKAGQYEEIIGNLPGFPDNINHGKDGTYWVGLTSPRSSALDAMSDKPFLRKIVQRLPEFLRPKAQYYGFVLQIDGNGKVLKTLQDPSGKKYSLTTGAFAGGDGYLYITSLGEKTLARLKN